jgi:ribosomal protein S3AE
VRYVLEKLIQKNIKQDKPFNKNMLSEIFHNMTSAAKPITVLAPLRYTEVLKVKVERKSEECYKDSTCGTQIF